MKEYGIGSSEIREEASEGILQIPQNRTLMVESLTNDAPVVPEVVHGLTNIHEVFQEFSPTVKVEFEGLDDLEVEEELHFTKLSDFGVRGITNQSKFLKELDEKRGQFYSVVRQLKKNKLLRKAIGDPELKESLLSAIHCMIREIDEIKK